MVALLDIRATVGKEASVGKVSGELEKHSSLHQPYLHNRCGDDYLGFAATAKGGEITRALGVIVTSHVRRLADSWL